MESALSINQINTQQDNETLFRMLHRGVDDIEAGREMPIEEAFEKITELRNIGRNARV